jgi:hypothetical protein
VIELKDTHIGLTAIDAVMRGEVLRNSAPISCAVARRIYHAPLIMSRPCFGDNEPYCIRSGTLGSGKLGRRDVWQNFRTEATDDKPHIPSR